MSFMIAISATRRRWWGNQTKTWRRELPQSWGDLQRSRRFVFWRMILNHGQTLLPVIVLRILCLPRWVWRNMDPDERTSLIAAFDWMQPRYDCKEVPFPSFTHRGETYLLPKARFENGTCLEFVLADGYYNRYRETEDEQILLKLVATLCRPAKEDTEEELNTGDARIPVRTKEQVEERAKALRGLDPAMQVAVLLYFVGVKEYVNNTYWMLFQAPAETEDMQDDAEPETPAGPKFGWWSKFMEVAESRLFGNYEEVLQKRLHLICMYLVDQHAKAEQLRREHQRQLSKFNTHDA